MPHCAAFGCNFQSKGNKNSDVSVHGFPSEKKRRAEWEKACGRTQLPKDPRLCSRHFSPDAFESFCRPQLLKELTGAGGYKRRLKPNAVPTMFSHKAPERPRLASEKRWETRERQATLDALLADFRQAAPPVTASECEPSDTTLDTEEPDNLPVRVVLPSGSRGQFKGMLIKTEPDSDSEMCPDPVRRRLSVQLTDCSSWLGPRNHIRLGEESVPVPCLPAGDKTSERKSFKLLDGLQSHQSIHWDKPAYRCTMCYKQFMREDDLRDHKLAHLSIKPFQGHERGNRFLDQTTLNLLMSTHMGEPPISCTFCGRSFSLYSSLTNHLRTHTDRQLFPCAMCNKQYTRQGDLQRHNLVHLDKLFECAECGKRFRSQSILKKHQHMHTVELPFSCPVCSRRFNRRAHLFKHRLTHTDNRPFPCSVCNKRFKTADALQSHNMVHLDIKPFECAECGKRFGRLGTLNRHQLVHTQTSGRSLTAIAAVASSSRPP